MEAVEETTNNHSEEEIQETPSSEIFNGSQSHTVEVDNLYKIKITYEEIPKINICLVNNTPEKAPETGPETRSCVNLCTPPKVREKSNVEKQNNLISILKKVTDNLEKAPAKKKSVNFFIPTNRSSPRFTAQSEDNREIASTFFSTQKFFIVIETFFTKYIKGLKFRNDVDRLLVKAFEWTKTIDIYLKLVQQSVMISKKRQNETSTPGSSTEISGKPKRHVSSSEEYSKRLHRKLTENRKLIMQSDDTKTTIEKDCSYAYNYLDRVKKTLIDCGDDELYTEFMLMLTSFNPDRESVPELYHVSLKAFEIFSYLLITFIHRKLSNY